MVMFTTLEYVHDFLSGFCERENDFPQLSFHIKKKQKNRQNVLCQKEEKKNGMVGLLLVFVEFGILVLAPRKKIYFWGYIIYSAEIL